MITLEIKRKYYTRWITISNQLHRFNRPANFSRHGDGKKLYEIWMKFGEYHRDPSINKPAYTRWKSDGMFSYKAHYVDGVCTREEWL